MQIEEIKDQICDVCHKMWQLGWVAANDGNVSVRLEDGTFLATPTGMSKSFITPDKLLRIDAKGNVLEGAEGLRPSSEIKMHLRCYEKRADVNAVVHAHPPAATGFAVAHRPMDMYNMIEDVAAIGAVPLTPYGTPSTTEVPDAIEPYLNDHDVMLLENHGALTVGSDVITAYYRMESLELWAKITINAIILGGSYDIDRKELQDGAAGIVFTPHFHYERISVEQFTARRKAAFLQVSAACKAEGLRLAGKMGAEVFYSTALPSLDLRQLAFAGSNYILIEFPTTMHPPGIDETLYAIRAQGYTPILAHVERYPFVTEDPTLLYNWVCDGCLAQINATGLIRDGHTAKWLHKLIEWNLVHILCSDCHHPVKRPPNLAEGFAHLPDKVARRMQRNAIDIYLGDDLRPPEPTKPVYRFGHWV